MRKLKQFLAVVGILATATSTAVAGGGPRKPFGWIDLADSFKKIPAPKFTAVTFPANTSITAIRGDYAAGYVAKMVSGERVIFAVIYKRISPTRYVLQYQSSLPSYALAVNEQGVATGELKDSSHSEGPVGLLFDSKAKTTTRILQGIIPVAINNRNDVTGFIHIRNNPNPPYYHRYPFRITGGLDLEVFNPKAFERNGEIEEIPTQINDDGTVVMTHYIYDTPTSYPRVGTVIWYADGSRKIFDATKLELKAGEYLHGLPPGFTALDANTKGEIIGQTSDRTPFYAFGPRLVLDVKTVTHGLPAGSTLRLGTILESGVILGGTEVKRGNRLERYSVILVPTP